MAPSKSSLIRSSTGPAKSKLLTNVTEGEKLTQKSIPEAIGELKSLCKAIDDIVPRAKANISTIMERDKQWQTLVSGLGTETEIASEQELYERVALSDGSDGQAEGYLNIVERAKEWINVAEVRSKEIRQKIDKITNKKPWQSTENNDGKRKQTNARLPKLQLPTFKGNPLQWNEFWSLFQSNIHDTSLTSVEKFSYLRSILEGTALDVIAGIPITEGNYEIAVSLLEERFKRQPDELIGLLYNQLRRIPTSSSRVPDLIHTFDCCERVFRQLESSGEHLEDNRLLTLDILGKFPHSMVEELFQRTEVSAHMKLGELRKEIRKYLRRTESMTEMLENLEPFSGQTAAKSTKSRTEATAKIATENEGESKKATTPTSAFAITQPKRRVDTSNVTKYESQDQQTRSGSSRQNPCYFCNGDHFNSECETYPSADERVERLRVSKRCFRCMSTNHVRSNCRVAVRCFFCKSIGQHCSSLCTKQFQAKKKPDETTNLTLTEQGDNNVSADTTTCLSINHKTVLSTAWTRVQNPFTKQGKQVRIFFDNGSHRSFITERCAADLSLTAETEETINVAVFATQRTLSVQSRQVQLEIMQKDGSSKTITAHTTPLITNCSLYPGNLPTAEVRLFESMKDEMADRWQNSSDSTIDILIGSDFFWDFLLDERIKTPSGLYMLKSTLGYLLSGKFDEPTTENTSEAPPVLLCLLEVFQPPVFSAIQSTYPSTTRSECGKPPDIDAFWNLERIGIVDDPLCNDDDEAITQFNQTVQYEDGRYQIAWPWKNCHIQLPSNYELALGRLRSLAKRLKSSSPEIVAQYQHVIDDQVEKGIIEAVTEDCIAAEGNRTNAIHYLPHHPVIKPDSITTQLRVVCDASAKTNRQSYSLNECLYRGPVLLPDLCSMLIRFRIIVIALIADIEKAFLQVGLQLSQRDVTRFLWFRDPKILNADNNIIVYRFCRLPFGIISSPFLLGATVQFHLKANPSPTAENIMHNIYVDNVVTGVQTEEEAKEFYSEAKALFNKAGMNLRQWCSNSEVVMDSIPDCDKSKGTNRIKVLGIYWNHKEDTLQIPQCHEVHKDCQTKREVLQVVASIYDPLGLFQPVLLPAKLFLQKLWKNNMEWDDQITEELQQEWVVIRDNIVPMFDAKVGRCISQQCDQLSVTILVFSDASMVAYGAAVYLRFWNENTMTWITNLVLCKSRLTPRSKSKAITLPRLELLGLLVGARAADFVRNSLPPSILNNIPVKIIMFSDSLCVLHWLRSDKVLSVFVENRISEIKRIKNTEFRYVESGDNPADICTRGKTAKELINCQMWWHGPSWLKLPNSEWPAQPIGGENPINTDTLDQVTSEVRKTQPTDNVFPVGEVHTAGSETVGLMQINARDYSRINSMLRITVRCLKFIKKIVWNKLSEGRRNAHASFKVLMQSISDESSVTGEELSTVRRLWIKNEQNQFYPDVISAVKCGRKSMLADQLGLQIDNHGVLRCYGRYEHADLPYDAAQPSLMPKTSYVTELFIKDAHERSFHAGVGHTLSQIRRSIWVPQGRNTVRKVLTKCSLCRRHKGPPFALPKMPPWPRERLSRSSPFRFTGLDYMGPVSVQFGEDIKKIWICLFTCLAVRAIHLEWIMDCSSKQFLACLVRFISRRGTPEQIISDNAPQFRVTKSAFDRIWHQVMSDESVQSYTAEHGIVWKFTTELAPWQGGFYERLVGIVKTAFRAAIGRRLLRFEELVTLSTEVEAVVNSRPLTYVYSDFQSGKTLRPIDFLTDLPVGIPTTDNTLQANKMGDAGKDLIAYWKYKQNRLDTLWKVWYDEYLMSLRERFQLHHRGKRGEVHTVPSLNDVVVVKDANSPRGSWKIAKVVRVILSNDGEVRAAEVLLPNKLVIRRTINHLYPLELDATNTDPNDESFGGFQDNEVRQAEDRSTVRKAILNKLADVASSIMFP